MNNGHDNTNRASLWNGDKSKNANAPDLRGKVNINGQDFDISLWYNQKSTGPKSPVYTGSVQPSQARQAQAAAPAQHAPMPHAPQPHQAAPAQPHANPYPPAPNPTEDEIPF